MELTVDQMLQQGVAAHNAGNPQEAERLYRAILKVQPKHPDANHNLGLIAVSMGQPGVALPLFKSAIDVNPNIEQFWLSYIEALIAERQFEKAKQALKKGKKKGVSKEKLKALTQKLVSVKAGNNLIHAPSQAEMQELINHYQNGQYGDAENLAILLTQKFPSHSFSWKILGAIYKALGRMTDALDVGKKAVELEPGDNEAHNSLGAILQDLGRFEESETSLRKAIVLKPDYADAYYNLGITLQTLGKLKEAEACYTQAIALKSDYADSHYNLGNTLLELGRLEEAEESLRQAIGLKPGYAEAHYNLGITLQEQGRLEDAEANLRQAIALKSDFAEAHSNLGVTLQELGRLEEAEANLRQAIALKYDFAESHSNLGNMLNELGRLEEAEASLSQAIALRYDFAEAHSNLGVTLQKQGRLEKAEASLRQAIGLKPAYAEAHNNLGNTLKELGRYSAAVASYRQAIALKPDWDDAHYNLGVLLFEGRQYNLAAEQFELSDIHASKLYAIKCLYLLDEETIFYEKFDFLVNQGEVNAVIGSLAFCSEVKYGIKKPNPFCSDPLKYVAKTDLNEQCDFENIFIKTARDVLTDNSVSYKDQGHLTNGVQTAGNIFAQGKVLKTEIESIIHAEIEKYRIYFKDSEEAFIKNWPTSYEISGWLVCMQSGGKLASHMHDNGWITGSVYINVPPKSKADSGNLVLCLSDQQHFQGVEKNQQSIIDVVTGSLCLFPSSLHHYTVPFEEKEDRIVLAFDVIPKS